jgi:hypothetical protein
MKGCALALMACTLTLSACAATVVPLEMPMDVTATVTKPRYTGWRQDYCKGEEDCLSVGGEIYKVQLLDVRTPNGSRVAKSLTIGFPAHGLPEDYRARRHLHLVRASDDLRKATAIEYVANAWE